MTAAIFGLVGVIVGGAITIAADSIRAALRNKQRTRTAARLVADELLTVSMTLRMVTEKEDDAEMARWLRQLLGSELIRDRVWEENRATLADNLDDNEWMKVADACFAPTNLRVVAAHGNDHALAGETRQLVADGGLVSAGRALSRLATPTLVGKRYPPDEH